MKHVYDMEIIMFQKRTVWFLIGGGVLGMLAVLLLFQYYGGKQPMLATASSVPFQSYPDAETRRMTVTPSLKNSPRQKVRTPLTYSDQLESFPSVSDPTAIFGDTPPLENETAELSSLVDSLSADDLEELQGLSPREFLSDEEQKALDKRVFGFHDEFMEITPKIVDLRQTYSALWARSRELIKDKPLENPEFHRLVEEMDTARAELTTLERRLPELVGTLLDKELNEYGYDLDQDEIGRIEKEILDGKGFEGMYAP